MGFGTIDPIVIQGPLDIGVNPAVCEIESDESDFL
jgi:hypothetical protein